MQLETIPIKLLIDTGCHGSLLRPYIAEKYFPEHIYQSNTPITTCAGTKHSKFKAKIPLLREFNIPTSFEFILFPFHEYFDGIIGLRDLKKTRSKNGPRKSDVK